MKMKGIPFLVTVPSKVFLVCRRVIVKYRLTDSTMLMRLLYYELSAVLVVFVLSDRFAMASLVTSRQFHRIKTQAVESLFYFAWLENVAHAVRFVFFTEIVLMEIGSVFTIYFNLYRLLYMFVCITVKKVKRTRVGV